MRTLIATTLACVTATTLVACSPGTPASTPTAAPRPTFQCTPEAGGTATPCSQEEFDAMKAKDALYAEAEAVQREFQAHVDTVLRRGGADALPAAMEKLVAGSAKDALVSAFKQQKTAGVTFVGEMSKLVYVRRNVGESMEGSEVSLAVCTDMRHVRVVQNGKDTGFGPIGLDKLYFKRLDGTLKVWAAQSVKDASCS